MGLNFKVYLQWANANATANIFLRSLSLLNVNIKFGSQQESIPVPPTPPLYVASHQMSAPVGILGAVQWGRQVIKCKQVSLLGH